MICHGDPKKAPMPVTSKYGMTSGYNYQPDSVVGTIGVGVPLADVNTLVMQRGLVVVGIITVIFSLIFIIINALVKKTILSPITSITEAAIVLSKGDLDREINIKQDGSEIGELANSFELLRRSLKWTMEQSK
jgi:methyl-accepting chemotaxis protein